MTTSSQTTESHGLPKSGLGVLMLGALGVVYGDIGTSPLYAMQACFSSGIDADHRNVLGILSLITWALLLTISLKYMVFVLRADNHGEGGVLSLMALAQSKISKRSGVRYAVVILLGLFGAALLYSDGIITPAISVL